MIEALTEACIKYAKLKDVVFSYKGKALSYEETFADFGVLPGIVKRASKLSDLCIGSPMGESYPKKERSYLGYGISFSDTHLPVPFVMLFVVDVLEGVIGNKGGGATVALDEFSYE